MKAWALILLLLTLSGCASKPVPIDDGFSSVATVVVGDSAPTQQAYIDAMEGYREDPAYACRHPLYAAYFKKQGIPGRAELPCVDNVPFVIQTPDEGAKVVWVNPARVRSVHLLFASKSPSLASQFGHVALRLVVCPESDSSAQACDANLAEHLVLSFQAHIDDYTLDTLKALRGDYQAHLFASRFMDTYEQYAIGEFREVYSLPLRIESEQRAALVRDLADVHWRFSGNYNFFTRNCATLLQDTLRVAWPDFANDELMKQRYLRPDEMFAALRASPLADGAAVASQTSAERDGYYFSSTRPFYEQALQHVRQRTQDPDFSSLEDYIGLLPIRRREAMASPVYVKALADNPRTLEAQLMLEEYAVLHSERVLMGQAAQYLEEQDFLARSQSLRARLDEKQMEVFDKCLLQPLRQRSQPPRRLTGIPSTNDEFSDIAGASKLCTSEQSRKLLVDTIAAIEDKNSLQWQQLNRLARYRADSIENIVFLKQIR